MGTGKTAISERSGAIASSPRFPFSQGPAAAPPADQTNSTTAGSNYNAMKPKRPVPAQSRPTARQTDRRAPGDAPDRAKRNPAPIPANPHGHWENSDFGEVRRDCKFPRFPCSQGPAAAPPADQTNSTTAGSNYNAMKPKRPVPAQSRPTARQTDSPRARRRPRSRETESGSDPRKPAWALGKQRFRRGPARLQVPKVPMLRWTSRGTARRPDEQHHGWLQLQRHET